jgi:1-acyl-sn-glycerol-3-phosphate acyltransferase
LPAESTPPSRFATVVASVAGNLYLVLGTLILSLFAIALSLLPPRTSWSFGIARIWSWGLLKAGGVRLAVRSTVPLDPDARYVFLANHQSHFDIPALLLATPGAVRLIAKRTLFLIPIFGWAMTASGFIPVDRENRGSARDTFAAAVARLKGGTSILLFPEGTRAREDRLLPFQRGGFLLALRSGLPIVPVGVRGSRAVRPVGSLGVSPGTIEVSFGTPLDPATFGLRRKGELVAEVRRQVSELAGYPPEPVEPELVG